MGIQVGSTTGALLEGLVDDAGKVLIWDYPKLTISAVFSSLSRKLEKLYPLNANSKNRVSSAIDFNENPM